MSQSPELTSLLVAACRRDAQQRLDSSDLERLGDRRFRRGFLDLAASHRILGLTLSVLSRALAQREQVIVDRHELDGLLRAVRRRAAVFELHRDQVVTALSSSGVRPVILKGAALAITVYEDPCERDLADLDILVQEESLEKSLQVLGTQGYSGPSSPDASAAYRKHHFHIPVHHSDGHIVEIHWALALPRAPFQLEASEVLGGSVPLERPGQPVLFLPRPEHTLLHLVVQNLQEGFSRLARLVDIDRILASTPGLNWEVLLAAARKGNLTSATAESLQLARRLVGAAVPDGVLRELRPGWVARFHLAIMRPARSLLSQRLATIRSAKDLHELWLLGGVRERLLLLRQMLVSDPAITFPVKKRPGALQWLGRLGKLLVFQLYLYGAATLVQLTPSGRARLRFW